MKTSALPMLAAVLCAAAGMAAEGPATAPANTWVEIPNTPFKKVAYPREKNHKVDGVCGSGSVIGAWSGGALDTKRNRLILWGGGHADYAGNELYAFDINNLAWERLTEPFPEPVKDQEVNADGTPNSRHTYGGLAYIAHADRFFGCAGSLWGVGFAKCNLTWTFDFEKKKWENREPGGDTAKRKCGFEIGSTYDPETKKVWWCENAGLFSYDYDGNAWKQHSQEGYYGQTPTVDTKRGLLVAAGHKKAYTVDLRGGKFTRVALPTAGAEEFLAKASPGFDYDPVADKCVGWSGGKVYVLDLDKKTWEAKDAPGAPEPTHTGIFGRWRYAPSVNAFVVVTKADKNVFFYKHTAGAGKAPNAATAEKK